MATGDFTPPAGGWQTGVDYTLQVVYNGINEFIASLGGQPTLPTPTISGPARGDSAYYAGKWIRTRVILNQAFTGDPDINKLHVIFDNVQVDTGSGLVSYDDFDGPDASLSLNDWDKNYLIGQATVTDNMLKVGVKAAVGDVLTSTHIVNRVAFPPGIVKTDTLQMDMKIGANPVPNSARTELRVGGSWGNGLYTSDTEAGYDGIDGGIHMVARLEKEAGKSTYRVICSIDMNDKSLPVGYQPITFDVAPAQPDTMYTAYLRKRGTVLDCEIRNSSDLSILSSSKDLSTAGLSFIAPIGESKEVSVRTRNAPAEAIGYFDNLYIEEMPGDINLSGGVNLGDIVLGLQILSGTRPDGISTFGDLNGDGKMGMEEIIYDMRHVAE